MSKEGRDLAARERLSAGATLEVSIERILPGDYLRVSVDRVRGSLAFATIREIIKPGPARVAPPCPYFGRCGGCDFQQLSYDGQLVAKGEIVRDCLRRIAGVEPPGELT